MTKFYVEYEISLFAVVEFDEDGESEVTEVHIADENLGRATTVYDSSFSPIDKADDELFDRVVMAAEDDGAWPVWEMGW